MNLRELKQKCVTSTQKKNFNRLCRKLQHQNIDIPEDIGNKFLEGGICLFKNIWNWLRGNHEETNKTKEAPPVLGELGTEVKSNKKTHTKNDGNQQTEDTIPEDETNARKSIQPVSDPDDPIPIRIPLPRATNDKEIFKSPNEVPLPKLK